MANKSKNWGQQLSLATDLHARGHLTEAHKAYKRLLRQFPLNSKLLKWLGTLEAQLGLPDEAKVNLWRAYRIDSNDAETLENLFLLLASERDWRDLSILVESLFGKPAVIKKLFFRGLALVRDESEAALAFISVFVQSNSQSGDGDLQLLPFLKGLIEKPRESDFEYGNWEHLIAELLRVLNSIGKPQVALLTYENLPHEIKIHTALLNAIASVYENLSDRAQAERCYREVIARDPSSVSAALGLANLTSQSENWNDSQSALEHLLNQGGLSEKQRHAINVSLATSLLCQGKFQDGYQLFSKIQLPLLQQRLPTTRLSQSSDVDLLTSICDSQRVWVIGDQGLGDQILYSSLVERLLKFTSQVEIFWDARLCSTVNFNDARISQFSISSIVSHQKRFGPPPPVIPISRLPALFVKNPSDLCHKTKREIVSTPKATDDASEFIKRLTGISGCQTKVVGLALFSSNPQYGIRKSLDLINALTEVGLTSDCLFLPLQPDRRYLDLMGVDGAFAAIYQDTCDRLQNDLGFVAALLKRCDFVLSGTNSVAHIAGAMELPLRVGVNFGNQLHYWIRFDRYQWYPKAQYVRQARDETQESFHTRLLTGLRAL